MNLKNQSILIVAPHPDDEAICCGGLIMKAKKEKAKVFVLYMSIGFSRQLQTGKTQSSIRIREAKNAAKYGNFSYEIVFNGDEFLKLDVVPQNTIINIIENTIQKIKPTIVCIPSRGSFNQDHRAISTACITALRPLPKKLSHQPTVILECEEPYTWTTENPRQPNFFIDISDVFEGKIELLKKHTTQLRSDPFPRSPQNLKRLAGFRGCEISVRYAEGYYLLREALL